MEHKTMKGNTMVIVLVVVAVAIVGYLIYSNNQDKQAAADAQVAQAEQAAMQAEKDLAQAETEAAMKVEATEAAMEEGKEAAAADTAAAATASCEETLAAAETNLPLMQEYAEDLEALGEAIDDDKDAAIEACRKVFNPDKGYSKNECETKVDSYVDGKTEVYDELQAEIATTEATIAAGC